MLLSISYLKILYRNILASASADKLVKIWDVATGKCNITMEHHTDKARTNPAYLLLSFSGSFWLWYLLHVQILTFGTYKNVRVWYLFLNCQSFGKIINFWTNYPFTIYPHAKEPQFLSLYNSSTSFCKI